MPKEEIDYSNTIFYKISCKNPSVSDIYIGHTTNFVQRKHAHKQSCKNPKTTNHNCKLYQVMRENDGWDNWNMEIIAFHACENSYSARKQEQSYFEQYNASLNSIEPLPKPRPKPTREKKEKVIHHCNTCKISFSTIKQHEIHNTTKKHSTNMKLANIQRPNNVAAPPRTASKYICECCNFECSKQSDFNRHILTAKHQMIINGNTHDNQVIPKEYICDCGKKYNFASGLSRHKKKCTFHEPIEEEPIGSSEDKLLIEQLMKSNNELKNMFVSVLEQFQVSQQQFQVSQQQNQENTKVLANTIVESMSKMGNTTNNNIDNRKITINQYLTETCVNAENIHDFTDRFVEGCGLFFENKHICFENTDSESYVEKVENI